MRVKSSMIRAVNFDKKEHALKVTFRNGSQYQYDEVPAKIANRVLYNKSHGKAFHRNVRDKFPTTKLREGTVKGKRT